MPDDPIALEAAVLLGRLCVDDENARAELKRSLESPTSDTHKKAKVSKSSKMLIEILVVPARDIYNSFERYYRKL